jgi:hypothetical protein
MKGLWPVIPRLYAHEARTCLSNKISNWNVDKIGNWNIDRGRTSVSIGVIPFSGKNEEKPFWSLAYARRKVYRDIILRHEVTLSDADKPADKDTQAEKDKYEKTRGLNDLACGLTYQVS